MSHLPRKGLGFFEKRKLEKQFSNEVPEFSTYAKKKIDLQNKSYVISTAVGVLFAVLIKQK